MAEAPTPIKTSLEAAAGKPVLTARKDITPFHADLVTGVETHLREGRVRSATEDLANPGKKITSKIVEDGTKGMFKGDVLDIQSDGTVVRKSSPESAARQAEAVKTATQLAEIAEKGYDKASPLAKQAALKSLATYFKGHDGFISSLGIDPADVTPANIATIEQQALVIAEAMLKSPLLIDHLKGGLADMLAGGGADYSELDKALIKEQKIKTELDKAQKEVEDNEAIITRNTDELKRYEETTTLNKKGEVVISGGDFAQARMKLTTELSGIQNEMDSLQIQYSTLNNALTSKLPLTISGQVYTSRDEIKGAMADVLRAKMVPETQFRDTTKKIEAIDAQKAKLEKELAEAKDKKKALEDGLDDVKDQKTEVDGEVKAAKESVTAQEEATVAAANGLLESAALASWKDSLDAVYSEYSDKLPAREAEALLKLKTELMAGFFGDVDEVGKKGKPTGRKVKGWKKAEIEKATKTIISGGEAGMDRLASSRVESLIIKLSASKVPEERQMANVLAQMKNDPEKMKAIGVELTKDILAHAALRTPKVLEGVYTADEAEFNSLTGAVLPDLILKASADDRLTSLLSGVAESGAIKAETDPAKKRSRVIEAVKGMSKKKRTTLLLLLLGLPAVIGLGIKQAVGH